MISISLEWQNKNIKLSNYTFPFICLWYQVCFHNDLVSSNSLWQSDRRGWHERWYWFCDIASSDRMKISNWATVAVILKQQKNSFYLNFKPCTSISALIKMTFVILDKCNYPSAQFLLQLLTSPFQVVFTLGIARMSLLIEGSGCHLPKRPILEFWKGVWFPRSTIETVKLFWLKITRFGVKW